MMTDMPIEVPIRAERAEVLSPFPLFFLHGLGAIQEWRGVSRYDLRVSGGASGGVRRNERWDQTFSSMA